jgi:Glycosyltransferase family 87
MDSIASMDSRTGVNWIAPPKPLYLLLWTAAALALYAFTSHLGTWILWDARVYARAIDDWRSGQNPYDLSNPLLLFVYPPVFLWVSGFLARLLPGQSGWLLYLAIYAASSLALPAILARFYLPRSWLSIPCAYVLAAIEPRFAALMAFRTGNITNIFYFAVLAAAVPGIRNNRWSYLYAAVFFIATVKASFLIMLLMPLLLGRRQWIKAILCGASAMAVYPIQKLLAPRLFAGFQTALTQQIAGRGAFGYGVMRIASRLGASPHRTAALIPYAVQVVFIAAVVSAMFLLRRRLRDESAKSLWAALVLLAAILCNPRILPYDSGVALLTGLVLLISALKTDRVLLVAAVIFLPSVLVPLALHHGGSGLYETFTLLICFAAGYRMLWRQAEEPALH